ncbi:Protein MS5 [Arabidopsis suecica]|uniref:Protein MS5 n=1 Tax=Arabidopsis suecica TaxID=45249 RepID=A0A8T2G3R9_ARASU|nr:Protein MS5 [Arabidopsis suecica]
MVVEAYVKQTEALEKKNRIVELMLEREHASSVKSVLETLNGLPGVRMWSPFHKAAIDHRIADEASRQGFIAFTRAEDKRTGEEDLIWDPNAVDDFCRGDMHKWLEGEGIGFARKRMALFIYAEVRAYLPFEMKKVVVQTREDIESSMKLKASNAIFNMNFKAYGGPQCRGIVRKQVIED